MQNKLVLYCGTCKLQKLNVVITMYAEGDATVRVNLFMAELKSLMETHGVELLNEQIKLSCAGNVHDIKTVLTD